MTDFFPAGSITRRVGAEPALFLGAGRALLLQLAHPAVALGVQDHSEFRRNPFKRLEGTMEAVLTITFGPEHLARAVGRRIQWIHEFVVGPTYRANDPGNLMWVHATLVDTALECYEQFVRPLRPADRDVYYEQSMRVAELFGVALADQPATYGDFRQYFADTVASIEVTGVARDLMAFILEPDLPLGLQKPLSPLLRLERLTTVAMTPPRLREEFGFRWDERRQQRFERASERIRLVNRLAPAPVRSAPGALATALLRRQAARHVAEWEAKLSAGGAAAA